MSLHKFEREGRKEGLFASYFNLSRDQKDLLVKSRVIDSKCIKAVYAPGRIVQWKLPIARLTFCSSHPQACSTEERKRDFEKIFAHYDVVSVRLCVVLATFREQACLAPVWGCPIHPAPDLNVYDE